MLILNLSKQSPWLVGPRRGKGINMVSAWRRLFLSYHEVDVSTWGEDTLMGIANITYCCYVLETGIWWEDRSSSYKQQPLK